MLGNLFSSWLDDLKFDVHVFTMFRDLPHHIVIQMDNVFVNQMLLVKIALNVNLDILDSLNVQKI